MKLAFILSTNSFQCLVREIEYYHYFLKEDQKIVLLSFPVCILGFRLEYPRLNFGFFKIESLVISHFI